MSEIFGVSTDYLLKNDAAEQSQIMQSETLRTVTSEEAQAYIELMKKVSSSFAVACMLCILSPVVLIVLSGTAVSDALPAGLGVSILLVMVACAVGIFVYGGMRLDRYKYISREQFKLDSRTLQFVQNGKSEYEKTFTFSIVTGVVLCIISVIPVIVFGAYESSDFIILMCVAALLALVGVAVALFVKAGMTVGVYKQLLQQGDYTPQGKENAKKNEKIGSVYWSVVLAAYLAWSFISFDWHTTWIIWPCAAILYGAVVIIVSKKK